MGAAASAKYAVPSEITPTKAKEVVGLLAHDIRHRLVELLEDDMKKLMTLNEDELVAIFNRLSAAQRKTLQAALDKTGHPELRGPCIYLTSTAFVTESQWVRYTQVCLARKGVLEAEDAESGDKAPSLEYLRKKYKSTIESLKVTYINDAGYHRPTASMAAGRMEDPETGKSYATCKVGEHFNDPHVEGGDGRYKYCYGRGEGSWFFWDQALVDWMGIPRENIKMIQLLEKPWLFNRPGRVANYDPQEPNVKNLDPEDEKAYYAALQLTQDAYDALKQDPPQVGAGMKDKDLPGCPKNGLNCADNWAKISAELNWKYQHAVDRWCKENIDGVDMVVGQGGEVVMLNMAWQGNQAISDRLVDAVRANDCIYAGLSASTMVVAKSMEMTGEIQPGWIEAFSCDPNYLSTKHFDENDLDGDGTQMCHLGALPLLEAPIAMRPHYTPAWESEVLKKNLIAEKEFEEESGIEVDDDLVQSSNEGCAQGCKLLTLISAHAQDQDNPVFVPIANGKVIEVNINHADVDHPAGHAWKEVFHCID